MSVIGAHALELLAFLAAVLATSTAVALGWGPQLHVVQQPVPVAPRR